MGGVSVIWCLKWNRGCFDVAFYIDTTLVTVQFTLQEEHSLKPNYIRGLRKALMDKSMAVDKSVHIGVRKNDWEEFQCVPLMKEQLWLREARPSVVTCGTSLLWKQSAWCMCSSSANMSPSRSSWCSNATWIGDCSICRKRSAF